MAAPAEVSGDLGNIDDILGAQADFILQILGLVHEDGAFDILGD
jgi:hypothetical protein